VRPGWIDVSVPISSGMVHWPDDPPVEVSRISEIAAGDPANVTRLEMSAHTGTHMDAPVHYLEGGDGIDALPFDATIGATRVIEISDMVSVKAGELADHDPRQGERLLLKTVNSVNAWRLAPEFESNFVYIAADAAAYLAERGVRCVGIDYLSVGGLEDDTVETHVALLRAGIWVIEGLNLAEVEPGDYELLCLPLKIVGSDGAPARALVRPAGTGEGEG
jgi:arylformamidase